MVPLLDHPRLLQNRPRLRQHVAEAGHLVVSRPHTLALRSQPFCPLLSLHSLETASLELLAAAARARIVASDLGHRSGAPTRSPTGLHRSAFGSASAASW